MKKIFFTFLLFLLPSICSASGYSYQRQITINGATYNPATQSNFTVLLCANGSSPCDTSVAGLNESGLGAHVTNSNGYDIVFSSTACTSPTLMSWEMENYVASTGEMEVWVLVPSLTTSNQTIYMCYGNNNISSFQGGVAGSAWNSNFVGVYHLGNGSSLSLVDSTSNGLTLTNFGATPAVAGPILGAASFNGSTQYLENAAMTLSSNPDFTASFWEKGSTAACGNASMSFQTLGSGSRFWVHSPFCDGTMYWDAGGFSNGRVSTSYGPYAGAWTYVTLVSKGDNSFGAIYLNGSSVASRGVGEMPSSLADFQIGNGDTNAYFFTGSLAEMRISKTVESADWITTEYNNQSSPSTFETFGGESATTISPEYSPWVLNGGTFSLMGGSFIFY